MQALEGQRLHCRSKWGRFIFSKQVSKIWPLLYPPYAEMCQIYINTFTFVQGFCVIISPQNFSPQMTLNMPRRPDNLWISYFLINFNCSKFMRCRTKDCLACFCVPMFIESAKSLLSLFGILINFFFLTTFTHYNKSPIQRYNCFWHIKTTIIQIRIKAAMSLCHQNLKMSNQKVTINPRFYPTIHTNTRSYHGTPSPKAEEN